MTDLVPHIRTVAVYVDDQARAERFYTEQLGWEVRDRKTIGPGMFWVEVSPPGAATRVVVYPKRMMSDWSSRRASVVLACKDTSDIHQRLTKAGVKFIQAPKAMPWGGHFAIFVDPDGNEFGVTDHAP